MKTHNRIDKSNDTIAGLRCIHSHKVSQQSIEEANDKTPVQLSLIETVDDIKKETIAKKKEKPKAEYGTFKDSLRAPVHRWFKYPAGYSYRLVKEKIAQYGLSHNHWIYDPFVGSGTTSIEAKCQGINSVGIDAHPFVSWVAKTKLNWTINLDEIEIKYDAVIRKVNKLLKSGKLNLEEFPELVCKCYSSRNLKVLMAIRNAVKDEILSSEENDFFNLALTDTLRNASKAATGWPYIAPNKLHEKSCEKNALTEFHAQLLRMIEDTKYMQSHQMNPNVECLVICGDSRKSHPKVKHNHFDLALTSPPYLNNYDYADRTRLETYFFGWYNSWSQITENVRNNLITSATTQVRRNRFIKNGGLSQEIQHLDATLFNNLNKTIDLLTLRRNYKGGRKSYDFMVAGYFNDMLEVIKQVFNALKKGSAFTLVLGDSAPYGVYIPTHEYLAQLGLGVGFTSMHIEELRKRGDKWRENPQRHNVKLNEVILTLTK